MMNGVLFVLASNIVSEKYLSMKPKDQIMSFRKKPVNLECNHINGHSRENGNPLNSN